MCLFFPSRPHPPLEIFFKRQCIAPTKWTFFFVLTDCEILINNFYIQIDEKKWIQAFFIPELVNQLVCTYAYLLTISTSMDLPGLESQLVGYADLILSTVKSVLLRISPEKTDVFVQAKRHLTSEAMSKKDRQVELFPITFVDGLSFWNPTVFQDQCRQQQKLENLRPFCDWFTLYIHVLKNELFIFTKKIYIKAILQYTRWWWWLLLLISE